MAQKRMFSKVVTNSDNFLDLPDSSQVLYFHLSMNADDDGFINNWKSIIRMTGTKEDDLKLLIAKSFIIPFESGVIVIRHWRLNNYLQSDRIKKTEYQDEFKQLDIEDNGVYNLYTKCIHSIDKNRIEENRIDKNNNICASFENEFEELWKLYPKKVGKKDALKHYIVVRKRKITKEQIEEGLNNFIEYINFNKTEYKYIPDGSTWFNQERWNDEYRLEKKIERKTSNIFAELLQEEEDGKETNIINADYVENSIS